MQLTNQERNLLQHGVYSATEQYIHMREDRGDKRSKSAKSQYWDKKILNLKSQIDRKIRGEHVVFGFYNNHFYPKQKGTFES